MLAAQESNSTTYSWPVFLLAIIKLPSPQPAICLQKPSSICLHIIFIINLPVLQHLQNNTLEYDVELNSYLNRYLIHTEYVKRMILSFILSTDNTSN